tara:strand:- start:550 stop:1359 length:810 start_codon:yes stop_codon:yes gene_type:complete
MSVTHNTATIVTEGLQFYYDVNNPKCNPDVRTGVIALSSKLYNLAQDGDYKDDYLSPFDTDAIPEMTFSKEEQTGLWIYDQDGTTDTAEDPGWVSNESYNRNVDEFTFFCWYNFPYGGGSQRTDNIYGGGFQSKTSFYLSSGGTSSARGFLRYPNSGSSGSYSRTTTEFNDPQQWLCMATTDENVHEIGGATTKLYFNGLLNGSSTGSSSFAAPSGTNKAVWGSWSGDYGPFSGKSNCFMYYERKLSADEILQNYNATKGRFGTNQDIE